MINFHSYLTPSGVSSRSHYAKAIGLSLALSYLVAPAIVLAALFVVSLGVHWLMVPVMAFSVVSQLLGCWLMLSASMRRCRDAFDGFGFPLLVMIGLFIAPFVLLALLARFYEPFPRFAMEHTVATAIVLAVLVFLPGMIWLGMVPSKNRSIEG